MVRSGFARVVESTRFLTREEEDGLGHKIDFLSNFLVYYYLQCQTMK